MSRSVSGAALSSQSKENAMKEDKRSAHNAAARDFRRMMEFTSHMSPLGATHVHYDGRDFTGWPDGDGEGMLIPITIGARGNLSKAEARRGAAMWREATERYPRGMFLLTLLGYDDDPREVWEFGD